MKKIPAKELESLANFVYEAGIHSKTPRSGFWLLGSGEQSVAEHLFRCAYITYALCHMEPSIDRSKAVMMALVHDFAEGRTSDLNYVHQKYGRLAEEHAFSEIATKVPFGADMLALYREEQERITPEAQIVKDADQIEWMATLREEEVKGNIKATEWIKIAYKRLKTKAGKELGKEVMRVHPDAWWFHKDDTWFVDRKKK